MKWRNRDGRRADEIAKRKPGDERIVAGFAWWPVAVGGETIWLRRYYKYYEWTANWYQWINVKDSLHDGSY